MAGRHVIADDALGDVLEAIATHTADMAKHLKLTPRELQVVRAVAQGMSNADIAAKLGLSVQTVKHYITSILWKTGVTSRLALAVFAIEHGLVSL